MTRKNALRDSVSMVRSRLPALPNLTREQIELALMYYDSDVDKTVQAFQRDGASEALNGWSGMNVQRDNRSSNNKQRNRPTSLVPTSSSNAPLRPSQRVSNLFQTFAEGGTPTDTSSGNEHSDQNLSSPIDLNDGENETKISSSDLSIDNSTKSEEIKKTDVKTQSTPTTINNNRKLLTKSSKDLQRQTSTLSNVELLFNNEIKASMKRIDEIFKEIRETIKEREVELYLQMDHVKAQGLNLIHRRQQRAAELRLRIDRCDRLEPSEIDHLRSDIKQFVTDRRYELGEELTSSHRFEYDEKLLQSLKSFGHVATVERKRSVSTSSALVESNVRKNSESVSTSSISQTDSQPVENKQNFNGNRRSPPQQARATAPNSNGYYRRYPPRNNNPRRNLYNKNSPLSVVPVQS